VVWEGCESKEKNDQEPQPKGDPLKLTDEWQNLKKGKEGRKKRNHRSSETKCSAEEDASNKRTESRGHQMWRERGNYEDRARQFTEEISRAVPAQPRTGRA